jgi:outer membrane protein assembly factor BamB
VTVSDIELPKAVMLHYYLYCLDIQTGNVVWKREFYSGQPPGGRRRKNSFASETPVTDGKPVYIYAANLGLYAYEMQGKQCRFGTHLWKRIRFIWIPEREDRRRFWGTFS